MKKHDPKYLGIPNINFSLTDKDDSREKDFAKQRLEMGFDESETWSLTNTIASFIIPRLEVFLRILSKFTEDNEEFKEDIKLFHEALILIQRDEGAWLFTKEEKQKVKQGLKVFPDIFMSLWW